MVLSNWTLSRSVSSIWHLCPNWQRRDLFYNTTVSNEFPLEESEAFIREHFPFARIVRVREAGHFNFKKGYGEFPKLMEEILAPVRLDLVKEQEMPVLLPCGPG